METIEKNPAGKPAKTKLYAKSKIAITMRALTLKIRIPSKFTSCLY